MKRITVTRCGECPFFQPIHHPECEHPTTVERRTAAHWTERRWIVVDYRFMPPECPLRSESIQVERAETVEDWPE